MMMQLIPFELFLLIPFHSRCINLCYCEKKSSEFCLSLPFVLLEQRNDGTTKSDSLARKYVHTYPIIYHITFAWMGACST